VKRSSPGSSTAHVHWQIPRFTDNARDATADPSIVLRLDSLRVIAWRLGAPGSPLPKNFRIGGRRGALLRHPRRWGRSPVRTFPRTTAVPCGRGLRGRIGFAPHVAAEVFDLVRAAIDRLEEVSAAYPLVRPGVSPHTLYTVGNPSFDPSRISPPRKGFPPASTWRSRRRRRRSFPMGEGDRLAPVTLPWGRTSLVPRSWAYDPAYLVETVFCGKGCCWCIMSTCTPGDRRTAPGGARFVLCPRSNAAHGNGSPDVTHFVDAKIRSLSGPIASARCPTCRRGGDARSRRTVQGTEEGRRAVPGTVPGRHGERGLRLGLPAESSPGRACRFIDRGRPRRDGDRFFKGLLEKTGRANVRLTVVERQPAHGAAA